MLNGGLFGLSDWVDDLSTYMKEDLGIGVSQLPTAKEVITGPDVALYKHFTTPTVAASAPLSPPPAPSAVPSTTVSAPSSKRDLELAERVRGLLIKNWDLSGGLAPGWTDSQMREMIVKQYVHRYRNVKYEPKIGLLTLNRLVNELAPGAVKKGAKPPGEKDVPVKSEGMSMKDLRAIIEAAFGGASESYKQYMTLEYLKQQQKNKPIQVPEKTVHELNLPRDYTGVWIGAGIAVLGLVLIVASGVGRRGRSRAPSGPVIDVTPTKYLPAG